MLATFVSIQSCLTCGNHSDIMKIELCTITFANIQLRVHRQVVE
jgi:hypothetical protein